MRRSTWNPSRRNRNLGTAKSGHGLDNRLVIPWPRRDPRLYWEALNNPVQIEVDGFTVFVEPCHSTFVHAATVDDVLRILGMLPKRDRRYIGLIVFRQATRKQRTLDLVWGRLAYYAVVGRCGGPAIILESQPLGGLVRFSRRLRPHDAAEIERLRRDGHVFIHERRGFSAHSDIDAVRRTQLYRTVPHEVGHYVHYRRDVDEPSRHPGVDGGRRADLHFSTPELERETFAHRYADEFQERMRAKHKIPFDRIVNASRWRRWRLEPSWFGVADAP